MAALVTPLMLAGTVMSAVGAVQAGTAQKNAALYNARLDEISAGVALDQAGADAARFHRQNVKTMGSIVAGLGASGGSGDDALSVLGDTAAQMNLDENTIKYQGKLRAFGNEQSAALNRQQAETADQQGALKGASKFLAGIGSTAVYTTASGSRLNHAPAGSVSRSFLVD